MGDTKNTTDTAAAVATSTNLSPEEKMIQDGFNELLQDYLKSNHRRKIERITKAFNFANQAHAGVKRRSGEPYIMHPIAVARIVCREMGLGSTSICSALLHDVVEDTEYTVEDIRNMFGDKIAQIVDGLTKISGGIFGSQASAQAENFRKLLLTMSDDIRYENIGLDASGKAVQDRGRDALPLCAIGPSPGTFLDQDRVGGSELQV